MNAASDQRAAARVPVAFWLVPAEPDRSAAQAVIDALARAHDVPPFEPHVSLHVGVAGPDDDVPAVLARVAAVFAPFTMTAGPTGHSAVRFKTLFVTFDDPRPALLQAALRDGLRERRDYALAPHLSLLYRGGMPEADRAALAAGNDWTGRFVRFDTLVAVRPGPHGFDDVAGWDTTVRHVMHGRG